MLKEPIIEPVPGEKDAPRILRVGLPATKNTSAEEWLARLETKVFVDELVKQLFRTYLKPTSGISTSIGILDMKPLFKPNDKCRYSDVVEQASRGKLTQITLENMCQLCDTLSGKAIKKFGFEGVMAFFPDHLISGKSEGVVLFYSAGIKDSLVAIPYGANETVGTKAGFAYVLPKGKK